MRWLPATAAATSATEYSAQQRTASTVVPERRLVERRNRREPANQEGVVAETLAIVLCFCVCLCWLLLLCSFNFTESIGLLTVFGDFD